MTARKMLFIVFALSIAAFCGKSADTAPKPAEQERPAVSRVGVVGQDIISITIEAGRVEHGRQEPYRQEKGDRVVRGEEGNFWVVRGGKMIGALIDKEGKMMTFDRVVGERPDGSLLDRAGRATPSAPSDDARLCRARKPTDRLSQEQAHGPCLLRGCDLRCTGRAYDLSEARPPFKARETVHGKISAPRSPGTEVRVRPRRRLERGGSREPDRLQA